MSEIEQSQQYDYPAAECYHALLKLAPKLELKIKMQDPSRRFIRGQWTGIGSAVFTFEVTCTPKDDRSALVRAAYDPKWTSFLNRPVIAGKPTEVTRKFDRLFKELGEALGSPGTVVDVSPAENQPYEVDATFSVEDNWMGRMQKMLFGRSPFVTGAVSGFAAAFLAWLVTYLVCLIPAVFFRFGESGHSSAAILLFGQVLLWVPLVSFMVGLIRKGLKNARMYPPSGRGLTLGIGLFALIVILMLVRLFS